MGLSVMPSTAKLRTVPVKGVWNFDEVRLCQQKFEALGQLAAGIAHEINTPMQYIGDSVNFLSDALEALQYLSDVYREGCVAPEGEPRDGTYLRKVREAEETHDPAYLRERIPQALGRTIDGIEHVVSIVRAIKEFAHPSSVEKVAVDLNSALENALTVSKNEYKYVASVETDFGDLPCIPCYAGEMNQVFVNLIVNAAHAISSAREGTNQMGLIRVRTFVEESFAVIEIEDSGTGIPEDIRDRIFEPFFTSKPVGKGTGQGLAISRAIVARRHAGTLTFRTKVGRGTSFAVRLPLQPPSAEGSES